MAATLVAGCARLLLDWPKHGQSPISPARLGPYRPGMGLRASFESLPGTPARARLGVLRANTEAWVTRWRLLAQAKRTLDVSYFILKPDIFGASFLGHLIKRAQEGVEIRVLLDAQGTKMTRSARGNDYLDELASTRHITVKMFRPLLNRYLQALFTLSPVVALASNHDKILVFDHRRGMIGGRNISVEYFAHPQDLEKAFRDTDVLLEGEAISAALTTVFDAEFESSFAYEVRREALDLKPRASELLLAYEAMEAWLKGKPLDPQTARLIAERDLPWQRELEKLPRLRGTLAQTVRPTVTAEMRLIDSRIRLGSTADPISQSLVRLMRGAPTEVLIESPYLVLLDETAAVLEEVGRRGVAITILTNSPTSSDNALSQAFFLEQWPELLARVPNLRLFVAGDERNVHSKLAVFDGRTSMVGTYNLDPLSMAINGEIAAVVWSRSFAEALAAHPRHMLAQGPPMVYEYTIRRDAQGRPERGPDGKVLIAFGPRDHSSPEAWTSLNLY
jgi:phosphatidylserine/phosphatidylglycerophosphate/cardiolipin synthase-like enzyme